MITAPKTTTLATTLAPEDITPGIYVAPLYEIYRSTVSVSRDFHWIPGGTTTFCSRHFPDEDEAAPVRVIGVCWPLVLVEDPKGKVKTVDTRRMELARLSDRFGREYFTRNAPKPEAKGDDDDSDDND